MEEQETIMLIGSNGELTTYLDAMIARHGENSMFVRYYKKFGDTMGIPVGWSDMDGYFAEIERCIEEGTPFDGEKYFPPLPEGAII